MSRVCLARRIVGARRKAPLFSDAANAAGEIQELKQGLMA